MKMSDVYTMPMTAENNHVYDQPFRYKIDFDASDVSCDNQAKAVAIAINNHDALVEALSALSVNQYPFDMYTSCFSCSNGANRHSTDCDYVAAINLLDKIKGES